MYRKLDWLGAKLLSIWEAILNFVGRGLSRGLARVQAQPERGDVPGWVLITLMTAGIVVLLMAVAGPTLRQIFVDAMNSVTG